MACPHWFIFLCVIGFAAVAPNSLPPVNGSVLSVATTTETAKTTLHDVRCHGVAVADSSTQEYNMKWEMFENVYYPSLIVLGCACNLLALLVLAFSPRLHRTPASVYLGALAVSDTVVLLNLLRQWLSRFDVGLPERWCHFLVSIEQVLCPVFSYLDFVPVFLSSWFVLAFTVERFVAVRHPIRSKSFCTKRKARIFVVVLCFLSLVFNSPLLLITVPVPRNGVPSQNQGMEWREAEPITSGDQSPMGIGVQPFDDGAQSDQASRDEGHSRNVTWLPNCASRCTLRQEYADFNLAFTVADAVIVAFLPAVVIVVLNTFIAATLWKERRRWSRVKPSRLRASNSTFTSSVHDRSASLMCKRRRSCPSRTTLSPMLVLSSPLLRPLPPLDAAATEDPGPSPDSPPPSTEGSSLDGASSPSSSHSGSSGSTPSPPDSPSGHLLHAGPEDFAYGPMGGEKHQNNVKLRMGVKGAKVTGILFVVSTAFVVLNLPAYVIRILGVYIQSSSPNNAFNDEDVRHLETPQNVAHVLYCTNFGINFLLYCAFGKNFRRSFAHLSWRVWRRLRGYFPCLRDTSYPSSGSWNAEGARSNSWRTDRNRRGESITSYSRGRTLTVTSEMSTRGYPRKGSS